MAESSSGKADPVSANTISTTLSSMTEKLVSILSSARKQADESMENFVTEKVWSLGGAIGLYADLFTSLHVTTRSAFEDVVKANFRNMDVRDEFEELIETETEWQKFLEGVERYLEKSDNVTNLKVNDQAPMDMPLVESTTGKTVTLREYSDNNSQLLVLFRHYA